MARHRWRHNWALFSGWTLRTHIPSCDYAHCTHDSSRRVQEVVSRSISSNTEKEILRDARLEVGRIIFFYYARNPRHHQHG